MRYFFYLSILCCGIVLNATESHSQTEDVDVQVEVVDGDTIFISFLNSAVIESPRDLSYRSTRKYKRTVKRVKKVLPYAELGAELYENYKAQEDDFGSNREKRKFLKGEEKRLKSKFEGKIRNLTINDGIVLIKLIDRQTSYTSYEILQELRGKTSAFLWQGVARLFSSSLKHQYDPEGDDWMIEEIIGRIQNGEL